MPPILGGSDKCPQCDKSVYFAEEARALGKKYHKQCLKCCMCNKALDSTNCNDHDGQMYCNTCYRRNFGIHSAAMVASSPTAPTNVSSAPPGVDLCFRCGKVVYMAERCAGGTKYFHKSCFRCYTCGVALDSNKLCVNNETHEIYCKVCYGKNFGPKGYGFAGGASGLSMDTGKADEITTRNVPALAQAMTAPLQTNGLHDGLNGTAGDNKDRCPRCKKLVYFAEKVVGIGQTYHKACFKCTNCNKSLDSTTLTEHDGNIYCKSCYGRLFGPKGFGRSSSIMSEQLAGLTLSGGPQDAD